MSVAIVLAVGLSAWAVIFGVFCLGYGFGWRAGLRSGELQ